MTAEECLNENIKLMGEPLGRVYTQLSSETAWLHLKWNDYCLLFAKDDARIALLNAAAPAFFGHLQVILHEDILLHACRLTDSQTQRPRGRTVFIKICRLSNSMGKQHPIHCFIRKSESQPRRPRNRRSLRERGEIAELPTANCQRRVGATGTIYSRAFDVKMSMMH